jgi:hypothetical protein
VLQDHVDGEPVLITTQGDGSIIVAFNLATLDDHHGDGDGVR